MQGASLRCDGANPEIDATVTTQGGLGALLSVCLPLTSRAVRRSVTMRPLRRLSQDCQYGRQRVSRDATTFPVKNSRAEDVETLFKLAEKEVLDYRLAHLREMRRGPAFWQLPDRDMLDNEERKRQPARRTARLGFEGVS
mgnify:CR=1 FL=1